MDTAVTFSSENLILRGNLNIPFEGAPCVILSHGLEGNKDSIKWKFLANRLYDLGLAALRFNYRGCGEGEEKSDGDFAYSGVSRRVKDFQAALDFLHSHPVDPSRLGAIGSSLGGTVLIASGDKRLKAMVALATPYSFKTLAGEGIDEHRPDELSSLPSGKQVTIDFLRELKRLDMEKYVKQMKCPLLVIHGSADETVRVGDAHSLYDAAAEPKMLKIINGAGHRFDDPAHLKQVALLACGWLKQYL
ncbi:MAG: prolyl oligopeptidase family serine peptidase [Dehalococcoidaceae bacterium]|nr:prolyl oligopeptidase family serine peptidase [Dehalococcoidaceae bacterium]